MKSCRTRASAHQLAIATAQLAIADVERSPRKEMQEICVPAPAVPEFLEPAKKVPRGDVTDPAGAYAEEVTAGVTAGAGRGSGRPKYQP